MTDTNTLAPCPFCGAGTTVIRENGLIWQGMKYGEPSSVSVLHRCEATPGQPSRTIERVGKDRASAIAAWNRRAPTTQAAPAPAAQGDALDAARYRRLRECNSGSLVVAQITGTGEEDWHVLTERDADEAIDAEINAARAAKEAASA